ncbi:MAG TPA: hypothetical protein VIR33_00970 [Thermopolyspora sp.]
MRPPRRRACAHGPAAAHPGRARRWTPGHADLGLVRVLDTDFTRVVGGFDVDAVTMRWPGDLNMIATWPAEPPEHAHPTSHRSRC